MYTARVYQISQPRCTNANSDVKKRRTNGGFTLNSHTDHMRVPAAVTLRSLKKF